MSACEYSCPSGRDPGSGGGTAVAAPPMPGNWRRTTAEGAGQLQVTSTAQQVRSPSTSAPDDP
jgi:hypothetical protein